MLPTSTSRPPVPLPWQYLIASSALENFITFQGQVWILREVLEDIEVKASKASISCINDWREGIAYKGVIASTLLSSESES